MDKIENVNETVDNDAGESYNDDYEFEEDAESGDIEGGVQSDGVDGEDDSSSEPADNTQKPQAPAVKPEQRPVQKSQPTPSVDITTVTREAFEKGKIEALKGTKNPYTSEVIQDEFDVKEYVDMLAAEKAGFDPSTEMSKFYKQQKKQEFERAQVERAAAQSHAPTIDIGSDIQQFASSNPDLNMQEILNDPDFIEYADGKVGFKPLTDIYNSFIRIKGGYERDVQASAQKLMAKAKSSPGRLSGAGNEQKKSYADMSDVEFEKAIELAKMGKLH